MSSFNMTNQKKSKKLYKRPNKYCTLNFPTVNFKSVLLYQIFYSEIFINFMFMFRKRNAYKASLYFYHT